MSHLFVQLVFAAALAAAMTGAACGKPAALIAAPAGAGAVQGDPELARIRDAVEAALGAAPPRGYAPVPNGLRLRSIARRADASIVLDFNELLLANGTGRVLEDALHQILTAASNARRPSPARADVYTVLVNGVPLETYLR